MASDIVPAVNRLSHAWARKLSDENVVASGLGVWVLLALLTAGSDGPARTELEAATGVEAAAAMAAAADVLARLRQAPGVRMATGVWVRGDVPLHRSWERAVPADTVGRLDANAQASLTAWVQRATEGEIARLPIQLTADTLLALVSALVARTTWREEFTVVPGALEARSWQGREAVRLTRTSSALRDVRISADGIPQVTTLRVRGDNKIDVVLVLGEPGAGAAGTLASGMDLLAGRLPAVTGERLPVGQPAPGVTVRQITATDRDDRLVVATIAFELASTHDLLDQAEVFGLAAAQDLERGHFPGVSQVPLAVGAAAQQAIAEFTATGFKAAAVTAIGMVRAAAAQPRRTYHVRQVTVTLDRPFGWVAIDTSSGLVIAFGWVQHPPVPR